MSFIYNNSIKYSDSPNLDAFGRLRVSNITSIIEVSQVFDKRPYIVDEVTGGTVTSVHDFVNSQVVMSGTGNSYVIRQTFQCAVYQPGKSQLFEASFSNFQLQNNVIKRVGHYNSGTGSTYNSDLDGYFLESNGITNKISFQVWKTGVLSYSSDTTNWDNQEVDILTIDWSKTNLMFVDYQWLGVGRIRFGLVLSGITQIFSKNSATNYLDNVYMSSPNKPIRYELRTSGGTGSFNSICSQVSLEGSLNQLFTPLGIVIPNTITLMNSETKYPVIGIKMASGYEEISPIISQISILNTSNDNYLVTLEIDPIISGSYSFSATSQPEVLKSVCDGSQTVSGQKEILSAFIGTAGTNEVSNFNLNNSQINPGKKINGTAQELWVCITPYGANASFRGAVNIFYHK